MWSLSTASHLLVDLLVGTVPLRTYCKTYLSVLLPDSEDLGPMHGWRAQCSAYTLKSDGRALRVFPEAPPARRLMPVGQPNCCKLKMISTSLLYIRRDEACEGSVLLLRVPAARRSPWTAQGPHRVSLYICYRSNR